MGVGNCRDNSGGVVWHWRRGRLRVRGGRDDGCAYWSLACCLVCRSSSQTANWMRFANRQGPGAVNTKDDIGGGEVTVVTGREESKTDDNTARTTIMARLICLFSNWTKREKLAYRLKDLFVLFTVSRMTLSSRLFSIFWIRVYPIFIKFKHK